MQLFVASIFLSHLASCFALNNGLARTPPCGLNSYMECPVGEVFLESIGDYFIQTGMHASCFTFVNSDEGWELNDRDNSTHELRPDPALWPSGLSNFTARLAAKGLKFGLYGAASGVTCNGVTTGQLGYEDLDVASFARWGVGFLKSDNCASYGMDSSVRFAATRDALLRANASIVYSIEPFSISPDIRQSSKIANMWRVAVDMGRECWKCVLDRASISDKWAPLAGPGGWNDVRVYLAPSRFLKLIVQDSIGFLHFLFYLLRHTHTHTHTLSLARSPT